MVRRVECEVSVMVVERVMVVVEVVAARVPVRKMVAVMTVVGRVVSCLRQVRWCRGRGCVVSRVRCSGIAIDTLDI